MIAGRYRLDELVGQGGIGRVWRGRDCHLDRVVAIKEVRLPQLPGSEHVDLAALALREAKAAARLGHPSVITIHDVVEHHGAPWIVMEFVRGQSLAARIREQGRLPWNEVGTIGSQVAGALAHAHAQGIVHRDVKPANILLSGRRAVVIDFGIARVLDSTMMFTFPGMLLGTPHYMAPEQIEGTAEAPADMWALGATLYTAVEGHPPFNGSTMTAVFYGILTHQPAPPEHAGPLGDVLQALLSKAPLDRPDADAAADALAAGTRWPRPADRQPAPASRTEATARASVRKRQRRPGDDATFGQRHHAEAEALYREAIRVLPDDPVAHYNLGSVLWKGARPAEAEAEYRKAIHLNPPMQTPISVLASCCGPPSGWRRPRRSSARRFGAIRSMPTRTTASGTSSWTPGWRRRLRTSFARRSASTLAMLMRTSALGTPCWRWAGPAMP